MVWSKIIHPLSWKKLTRYSEIPFTFNLLTYLTFVMKEVIVSFSEATALPSSEKASMCYMYFTDQNKYHENEGQKNSEYRILEFSI